MAEAPHCRFDDYEIKCAAEITPPWNNLSAPYRACRRKKRMSGLCKVQMSAFMDGRGPHGNGANRVEPTRTGPIESVARGTAEAPVVSTKPVPYIGVPDGLSGVQVGVPPTPLAFSRTQTSLSQGAANP